MVTPTGSAYVTSSAAGPCHRRRVRRRVRPDGIDLFPLHSTDVSTDGVGQAAQMFLDRVNEGHTGVRTGSPAPP
ncbi:hypothetical protein ACIBBD_24345 [Streptomyces sp. NPDC051315]|uniref:hypothetical protein n=1 Tax=Streptomyces sp. NPDC051315 TaxID=3365650 RepID=UPI0037AAF1ED